MNIRAQESEAESCKMPRNCCVTTCENLFENGFKAISFPNDEERKTIWIKQIRQGINNPNWNVAKSSRICEVCTLAITMK